MAVTITSRFLAGNFNTTGGDVTGSAGCAVGDVYLLIVAATGVTGTFGATDTSGGTYTRIATCLEAGSVNQATLLVRDQLTTGTTLSITTSGLTGSTGGGFAPVSVLGLPASRFGVGAIKAFGQQSNRASSSGVPSVTLNAPASTTNPLVGFAFGTSVGTTAGPTGWTNGSAISYATPTQSLRPTWIITGFAAGATVAWTTNAASTSGCIAVELDTTVFAPTRSEYLPALQAVNRSSVFMRRWARRTGSSWGRRESGILVPGLAH